MIFSSALLKGTPQPPEALSDLETKLRAIFWQMSLLFSPVINILTLTSSFYMMQVYDRVLTSHSVSTLIYLTLIATGAIGLMSGLELLRGRILNRVGSWIEQKLAPQALEIAIHAARSGQIYRAEILRDLSSIRSYFSSASLMSLMDLPWMPVFLIALFALHPAFGWLCVAGAVILSILAFLNDKLTHKGLKEATLESMKAMREAEQAIRNAEVVDAMGMMGGVIQRWRKLSDTSIGQHQASADASSSLLSLSRFVRYGLQILVLAIGAHLALNREITGGGMIAASIIMARALAPIEGLIGSWRQTLNTAEAYSRIISAFQKSQLSVLAMDLPAPQGHLSVENLTYVFPGRQTAILKGVSFEAKPGQIVAIIGPSASGKSTLMRLCVGAALPTYGHIRLDGADLSQWSQRSLSPYVGYLPQDVELFSGSVRENIARLMPASDEAVIHAAQLAGAHEMILRLPQGYDTEIGEGGAFLSGGQRQRLGLARALLNTPKFVVLDEPNSSLDSEGEEALNTALSTLKKLGTTVLLVGHRPSILIHCDTVIVLKDGRIEAAGPKDEILARLMKGGRATTAEPLSAPSSGDSHMASSSESTFSSLHQGASR